MDQMRGEINGLTLKIEEYEKTIGQLRAQFQVAQEADVFAIITDRFNESNRREKESMLQIKHLEE